MCSLLPDVLAVAVAVVASPVPVVVVDVTLSSLLLLYFSLHTVNHHYWTVIVASNERISPKSLIALASSPLSYARRLTLYCFINQIICPLPQHVCCVSAPPAHWATRALSIHCDDASDFSSTFTLSLPLHLLLFQFFMQRLINTITWSCICLENKLHCIPLSHNLHVRMPLRFILNCMHVSICVS